MRDIPSSTPPAISDITDPAQVRVAIFINNQTVHVPLAALLKHIQSQLDDHEARITALETP